MWSITIGHSYNIYPDSIEGFAIDAYAHLNTWLDFLQRYHYRSARLMPDDFIFPSFHLTTGEVHRKKMCTETFMNLLKEFAFASGLVPRDHVGRFPYSTHCLRRGGAQYWFMLAPIGRRWTLSGCKWWGGWAEGEQVRTLICRHPVYT